MPLANSVPLIIDIPESMVSYIMISSCEDNNTLSCKYIMIGVNLRRLQPIAINNNDLSMAQFFLC